MCRLAAYIGAPRALADVFIEPSHSLIVQSQEALEAKLSVNGDGFGIAWYGDLPDPGLYRDILPAWSDSNLLSLCNHISSPLFLAHVRASTEGETARSNCHPFVHGTWSFMHNGQIGSFSVLRRRLEAMLPDELYALRRGSTDSELLFLLLIHAGLETDAEKACSAVVRQLDTAAAEAGVRAFYRLTCVFSDGQELMCFRVASDGRQPSLYVSGTMMQGGLVIASEPLDGSPGLWSEVPPNQLVRFRPSETARAADLFAA